MQKNWRLNRLNPELISSLSKELQIHPLIATILTNRGINDSREAFLFLKGNLSDLSSPFELPDAEKAIQRITQAIRKREKVFIFSDYDTDGITASALLISKLKKFDLDLSYYIPDRIKEGYGLNEEITKYISQKNIDLLIAIDCGTTNFEEIRFLKDNSVDTIIIDHHLPKEELPSALAIVNPKRADSNCRYREFASCGLVFKLAQGLLGEELGEDLDLVCLGTVADMCPLNGENRILIKEGLHRLNGAQRLGTRALIEVARLKNKTINSYHIGFILAPRINASGRVDTAEKSLELLLTDSYSEAERLAENLNQDNLLRRRFEEEVLEEAEAEIEERINFKEDKVIILARDNWHVGVLGIIANRILKKFYRPAIVMSLQEDRAKGSCRSIKDFHILNALSECKDLLLNFGGHAAACGFTILRDNLDRFKSQIRRIAHQTIASEFLIPFLEIDAEIELPLLNLDLINLIQNLEPYGIGNPRPLFCTYNLKLKGSPVTLGKNTLKFYVTDGNFTYPALGFGMSDLSGVLLQAKRVDLAYHPSLDIWEGEETIQLEVKDIKIS